MDTRLPRLQEFQATVDLTGPLEGEFEDWPSHIQDKVYAALEKCSQQNGNIKLGLMHASCQYDVDTESYYAVLVACEMPHIPEIKQ